MQRTSGYGWTDPWLRPREYLQLRTLHSPARCSAHTSVLASHAAGHQQGDASTLAPGWSSRHLTQQLSWTSAFRPTSQLKNTIPDREEKIEEVKCWLGLGTISGNKTHIPATTPSQFLSQQWRNTSNRGFVLPSLLLPDSHEYHLGTGVSPYIIQGGWALKPRY